MARSKEPVLQPRLRIVCGDEIALGPGKAQLLELIGETGSIADSARKMRMSYMRAWSLVQTMNRQFHKPLIVASRGGQERGGTGLTDAGREVLRLYRELERGCEQATRIPWGALRRHLAPSRRPRA